jgi:hypothetical protein
LIKPTRGAPPLVKASLAALALLCFLHFLFAWQMKRSPALQAAPVVLGVVALVSIRLPSSVRSTLLSVFLAGAAGLYLAEGVLGVTAQAAATAAWKAGRSFDSRSPLDVYQDMLRDGIDVVPTTHPRFLLEITKTGFLIDGVPMLPLAGIANKTTLYCNESGQYIVYNSDEHGFHNPRGLWHSQPIDVVVVGDSLTQGACVPSESNLVAQIRRHFPATLNLGNGGSGPLLQLAVVREFLPALRPKIVLWSFYENDIRELASEKNFPLLTAYLSDGHRQGLLDKQEKVDRALADFVGHQRWFSAGWPPLLASAGILRDLLPVWMQDLVGGTSHTRTASTIRLDQVNRLLSPLLTWGSRPAPDYPLLQTILEKARNTVQSWGGRLYVLSLPSSGFSKKVGRRQSTHYAVVHRILPSIGIPLIDVTPAFESHPDPTQLFYHPYSHYNEQGYAVAAEVVVNFLKAQP